MDLHLSSVSPSVLRLSFRVTAFITWFWGSTAMGDTDRSEWADARTWWTNLSCTGRWASWWQSSRVPTSDTSTHYRRWGWWRVWPPEGAKKPGSLFINYFLLLAQVKIGLYVPHDPHVFQPIEWKHLVLNAARLGAQEMRKELEKHGRDMRMKVLPTSRILDLQPMMFNLIQNDFHS